MKTPLPLYLALLLPWAGVSIAQVTAIPSAPALPPPPPPAEPYANFPKFDLDFPGGTPQELVGLIEKATQTPLNVIIPAELSGIGLPNLKLRNVTVPQLFDALEQASRKTIARVTGYSGFPGGNPAPNIQMSQTSYGFKTAGPPTPDSVWYFRAEQPPNVPDVPVPTRPKICRFFQLGPYLDNYKVELKKLILAQLKDEDAS